MEELEEEFLTVGKLGERGLWCRLLGEDICLRWDHGLTFTESSLKTGRPETAIGLDCHSARSISKVSANFNFVIYKG